MDDVKTWFENHYVTEVQTRISLANNPSGRMGMIYSWRTEPRVSLWKSLPGETPPHSWLKKPSLTSLEKQAREAWERCDKTIARELYDMWTHECPDPYYCPCHGFGSD